MDGPLGLEVLQHTKYYGVLCILLFHAVLTVSTMSVLLFVYMLILQVQLVLRLINVEHFLFVHLGCQQG